MVGVIVCAMEKEVPVVMTIALTDAMVDTLETVAKVLKNNSGAPLCLALEVIVAIVDDSVV